MGVIEQAIYFALGCIVTALLALLFAPVFWSRALRLTRKRLQLQVPLSMQEILAERDQLRAAHAVDRLRVEQEMESVRAGKDADMVAIGRSTVEAARLAAEVGVFRDLKNAQAREIALLTTAVASHEVEGSGLRKDLIAAHGEVEQLRAQAEAAVREHARLHEEGEGHRTSAAALVARLAAHDAALARIGTLEAELADALAARDAGLDREKGFHLGNSLKAEKSRATDRAIAERLDRLEAENLALKATRSSPAPEQGRGDPADAALRESIHALGLAVATMSRKRSGMETAAAMDE